MECKGKNGLCIVLAISLCGCAGNSGRQDVKAVPVYTAPLARIERDVNQPFPIDPNQPFQLGLGRGSWETGLNTILIRQDGAVILYRLHHDTKAGIARSFWGKGVMQIDEDSIEEILESLKQHNIMHMAQGYYAKETGGSQWIFLANQEKRKKTIFCDNHIPERMQQFAAELDAILEDEGLKKVTWEIVAGEYAGYHDDIFWKSIETSRTGEQSTGDEL